MRTLRELELEKRVELLEAQLQGRAVTFEELPRVHSTALCSAVAEQELVKRVSIAGYNTDSGWHIVVRCMPDSGEKVIYSYYLNRAVVHSTHNLLQVASAIHEDFLHELLRLVPEREGETGGSI